MMEKSRIGQDVPAMRSSVLSAVSQFQDFGTYPIQQELLEAKHPLNALPERQVRLFSDCELVHDLPKVAQLLLN